ncbi:MAG: hypothetical protein GX318_07840 [Clostridia bacterium]|nr:hypothetical protein [Clostridia bacterium]
MSEAVLDAILNRATVRSYLDKDVSDEIIEKLAKAAQQAPFTGQMYAFIYTKDQEKRDILSEEFGHFIAEAPVFILFCMDFRKLEKFIAYKGRENASSDIQMLFLGIQDVAYAAANWVTAAEALGLGTCYFGRVPLFASQMSEMFNLPDRVYPVVGMAMGYPAVKPNPRPRIPTSCVLFKDEYKDLSEEEVAEAMTHMDAGLIREGYYKKLSAKIPRPENGEDTVGYDSYGWSEHISRKYARQAESERLKEMLVSKGITL